MDTLGSEVGTKMMSAVKAKLIELGSGGSSGYIDDELPDYVMIMVANKRSKQQMIEDLNLFLGTNTEPFVNWLHQVLQKLQEVTLSATAAAAATAASSTSKTKRKLSESTDKKDKKEKKKKMKRSQKEKSQERTSSTTSSTSTTLATTTTTTAATAAATIVPSQIVGVTPIPAAATTTTSNTLIQSTKTTTTTNPTVIPSITDVFADHFIQRARETIRIESSLSSKVKNEEKLRATGSTTPPPPPSAAAAASSAITASQPISNTTNITSTIDNLQTTNQLASESGTATTDTLLSSGLNAAKVDDGFDIPTISEISKNSVVGKFPIGSHKEVVELAELQKIIYQAKRQLKSKGLVDDDFEYDDDDDDDYGDGGGGRRDGAGVNQNTNAESEDEDFINLKADGEELDDDNLSGLMDIKQNAIAGGGGGGGTKTKISVTSPKRVNTDNHQNVNNNNSTHRSNNKSNKSKNEYNRPHESDSKSDRHKKNRSFISYEEMDRELQMRTTTSTTMTTMTTTTTTSPDNETNTQKKIITKKPSIMDRLGVRPTSQTNSDNIISLSAHRRTENEMYTSAAAAAAVSSSYRRNRDDQNEIERLPSRSSDNDIKKRIPISERLSKPLITISNSIPSSMNDKRDYGQLNKEIYRTTGTQLMMGKSSQHQPSTTQTTQTTSSSSSSSAATPTTSRTELSDTLKSRIGSRVIKAPPKPQYDEDYIEVPINSVVKIQPRPKVPSNKQACTHLLLRAVAEAQKSTAFIKPKPELRTTPTKTQSTASVSVSVSASGSGSRSTKQIHHQLNDKPDLFTKTYRDNNNLMLKTRQKQQKDSFVIQIPGDSHNYNDNHDDDDDDTASHDNANQHHHHHHQHRIRINNNDDGDHDDDDDDDIVVTEIDDEMVVHRIEDDEEDVGIPNMEVENIDHDEEYIPEVVAPRHLINTEPEHEGNYVYIPVNMNSISGASTTTVSAAAAAAAAGAVSDDDIKSDSPSKNNENIYEKTQFVVTLDGAANFNNKSNDDNLLKIPDSRKMHGIIQNKNNNNNNEPQQKISESSKMEKPSIKHHHSHHHHSHHHHHRSHQSSSPSRVSSVTDKDEQNNSQKLVITKTVTNDRIDTNNKLKSNKADLHDDNHPIIDNDHINNIVVNANAVANANDDDDDYNDENVNELRKIVERSSKKNRESKKLELKNKNLKRSRVSPIKFDLFAIGSGTGSGSSTTTISKNNLNESHKSRSSKESINTGDTKHHSKSPNKKLKIIHNQNENHLKYNTNNINIITDHDMGKNCNADGGGDDDDDDDKDNKQDKYNSDNIQIELPKESRRVKIMKSGESNRKYENIPSLSSAIISGSSMSSINESGGIKRNQSKGRCTYYPTCGKGDNCEFMHPIQLCKTFPNCTFGDKCLYIHPKCKFDLTCTRLNCNFYHSTTPAVTTGISVAAPLSSHVVPVSNYKTITSATLTALCRFFPNCTNTLCTFFHPKPCHFGKFCNNKMECQFYHFDLPPRKDKLKWVATTTNPQSLSSMNITSSSSSSSALIPSSSLSLSSSSSTTATN